MQKLMNEPIVKALSWPIIASVVVSVLASLGVISAEQSTAILSVLATFGVGGASAVARRSTVGPVTFARATRSDTHPTLPVDYLYSPYDWHSGDVSAADEAKTEARDTVTLDEIPDGPQV